MWNPGLGKSLLAMALLATPFSGSAAEDITVVNGERPHGSDAPTRIETFFYLIDVTHINGATQSFTADLFVLLRWHDERLASSVGNRRVPVREVWAPQIQLLNRRSVDTSFPEEVLITADGTVTYRQRYFGGFSARLDLHDFPLDRHTLGFRIVVPGYSPGELEFVGADGEPMALLGSSLSIVDWAIDGFTWRVEDFKPTPGFSPVAGLVAEFHAHRFLGFYVSKAILSVAIIVFMSWIVFWVDPKNIAPRMSVSVTAMLTLIAYRFLLGQVLPPLSYLTRMDHFLLGSTVLVFLGIVEVAAASRLNDGGHLERALALDRFSRVAFPAAFLALCVLSFWML